MELKLNVTLKVEKDALKELQIWCDESGDKERRKKYEDIKDIFNEAVDKELALRK